MSKPVLLVEDSEDDVLLAQRAWKRAGLLVPLFVVRDGEEAMSYLAGKGPYANRGIHPLPSLLLLDLKMPKVQGLEVLRWIRQESEVKALPVIVLTSSDEPSDMDAVYALGANAFLVKPPDPSQLLEYVKLIEEFWLEVIRLPEERAYGMF